MINTQRLDDIELMCNMMPGIMRALEEQLELDRAKCEVVKFWITLPFWIYIGFLFSILLLCFKANRRALRFIQRARGFLIEDWVNAKQNLRRLQKKYSIRRYSC